MLDKKTPLFWKTQCHGHGFDCHPVSHSPPPFSCHILCPNPTPNALGHHCVFHTRTIMEKAPKFHKNTPDDPITHKKGKPKKTPSGCTRQSPVSHASHYTGAGTVDAMSRNVPLSISGMTTHPCTRWAVIVVRHLRPQNTTQKSVYNDRLFRPDWSHPYRPRF
jgi:hypothetical protein